MKLAQLSKEIEALSGIKFSEKELSVLGDFSLSILEDMIKRGSLERSDIKHLKWYKREHIPRLLKERKELFNCLVLDAKEGATYVSVRNYCRPYESPSDLLKILRPFLPELEQRLKELGYVKIKKGTWRRFDLKELKEQFDKDVSKLKEVLGIDEDSAYIVYVAYRLLKITNPFKRDWKGFNIVHAFAFYDRFLKPTLTFDDVNWMNKRLLQYEEQIKMLGLDFSRIQRRRTEVKAT